MDATRQSFASALDLAAIALSAMSQSGVPPTPRNYSVWFAHAGGTIPELSRTLEAMIANRDDFTVQRNEELFVRFIAAEAQTSAMQQAGKKLQKSIGKVLDNLTRASGDTKAYGEKLDAFSAELGGEQDLARVREVVDGLIADTQLVVAQNDDLSVQLVKSAGEIAELRRTLAIVEHEAMTDGLTAIANRKYFDIHLRKAVTDAKATGRRLSLLFIDIDHFKRFNDTWGHQLGDQVLRLVGKTLTDCVKPTDVTARYGGEEFAIVLEDTCLADAMRIGDLIRATMERRRIKRRDSGDDLGAVTVSVGASVYRIGEEPTQLIDRADAALYHAKRTGRNRVASEDEVESARAAVA